MNTMRRCFSSLPTESTRMTQLPSTLLRALLRSPRRAGILVVGAAALAAGLQATAEGQCNEIGSPSYVIEFEPGVQWSYPGDLEGDRAFVRGQRNATVEILDYSEANAEWTGTTTLTRPEEWFGFSISASGDRVAIGAPDDVEAAAYVFAWNGSDWVEQARLIPSESDASGDFGWAIALEGDDLFVTDRGESDTGNGFYAFGSVTHYRWDGLAWNETQRLLPPIPGTGTPSFGYELSLDGEVLAVSYPNSVLLYRRDSGTGQWAFEDSVQPPSAYAPSAFGFGAISLSGNHLAVGDHFMNDGDGGVFVFERRGEAWVHQSQLCLPPEFYPNQFGRDVSLVDDVLVAASGLSDMLVYDNVDGVWVARPYQVPLRGNFASLSADGKRAATQDGIVRFDTNSLTVDIDQISIAAGGVQTFSLDAGSTHADKLYYLLGSISGTSPGFPVGGLQLPLNFDSYFLLTLTRPNVPPLTNSRGLLSSVDSGQGGTAQATFELPPGAATGFEGLTLDHAFLVLDSPGVIFASNAVTLDLVP